MESKAAAMKVSFALVLLSLAMMVGCSSTYVLPVERSESLREDVAIRISKKALEMHGVDVKNFVPSPYRENSTEILARNALGENAGYVIWRQVGDLKYGYSVSISQKNGKWVCVVGRLK